MALINCKECNTKISDNAKSCPNCGNPNLKQEKSGGCSTTLIIVGIIFFIIFIISQCENNSGNSGNEVIEPVVVDTSAVESGTVKVKKLTSSERKENIEKLRNMFLDSGIDVEVSVYGKDNEILELKYLLFDDVWFRKFETNGMFDNLHNLGYKKIILNDNNNYKTSISY